MNSDRDTFKPIPVQSPASNWLLFYIRRVVDLQFNSIIRYLRPAIKEFKGQILDVGAGQSPWRAWMPATTTYVGLDIKYANDFGMSNKRKDIVYYAGGVFPFIDESFDGAICIEVLEHVESPDEMIAEIARCLKPGAILLLSTPWSARRHHIPYDFHRFSCEQLEKLLSTHGFSKIFIRERGSDISAIANKLLILNLRQKPNRHFFLSLLRLPFFLILLPLTSAFILTSHIAEWFHLGGKEDPLGYFIRAIRK